MCGGGVCVLLSAVNQAAAKAGVGVPGESLLGTIKIAVLPIAKLVFSLLLPCLIFSQLGQAVTIEKMLEWWFIPMNVVLGSLSGSLIGFIVASLVRPPCPSLSLQ
ncbi:protein PIN-LIKES 6 [Fagus crenata]